LTPGFQIGYKREVANNGHRKNGRTKA